MQKIEERENENELNNQVVDDLKPTLPLTMTMHTEEDSI